MSDEIGKVRKGENAVYDTFSNGQFRNVAINGRGEMVGMPWWQQMVAEGNVFTVNIGDASTPNVFTETAYDQDQPQFGLDVPSGTTIIPLSCTLYWENQAGTDNEFFMRMDDGLLGAGTSTGETIFNMLQGPSDTQRVSRCTARIQYTGNAAAITVGPEFIRFGNPFAADATEGNMNFEWTAQNMVAPVIQGEACISGYALAASTDPEGFLNFTWAEFNTAEV
jgi:hypothetical protein